MPEITKFYTNGALSFAEIGASDKVPLKKIVQLFGEGVCITVKTDTGHKLLTPYLLTALENKGFAECFRVLSYGGVLIFKWNETDIPLKDVLKCTPEKPVFGHKSGKRSNTHWLCFYKS